MTSRRRETFYSRKSGPETYLAVIQRQIPTDANSAVNVVDAVSVGTDIIVSSPFGVPECSHEFPSVTRIVLLS